MIIGAHSIIYCTNPGAYRTFLRHVLQLPSVDVGGGWLIFGLRPAQVAVHPSERHDVHEFYLMCDDVERFIAEMEKRGIACGPVQNQGWGLLTQVTLPGGGKIGICQPRHARPKAVNTEKPTQKPAKRGAKSTPTGPPARCRRRDKSLISLHFKSQRHTASLLPERARSR
jgi:hypothetical protein